jgi:hypothetical protein
MRAKFNANPHNWVILDHQNKIILVPGFFKKGFAA